MEMSKQLCPECGKTKPAGAPDGACPTCLLALGLAAAPSRPETIQLPPMAEPGERIGRYKLLEQIGEGGFGTVWMAEQQEPVRRRVALKIIKLGMDTKEVIARFEAERQALAMMDHPNIARVFDGGATENGRPYFVMELVRGARITDYCDVNRLSTEERLKLFMQVCHAVQHAHQKGIIHRDLKPSNVLVTVQDDQPVPKVIDFGIAKATGAVLTDKTFFTGFNQMIGTPAYMSPEQTGLGGLDIDTRSDIYSLGVLLYELLTGRPPFARDELLKAGLEEVLRIIRDREPPKPSTRLSELTDEERLTIATQRRSAPEKLNRLVRGELDWIVMKAMEKDRTRRYESANGLARDLERHLNHEPVQAVAPSASYQARKFARRHRVALVVASAFAAVSLVGTVTSVWQARKANQRAASETQAKLYAQKQEGIAETMLARAEKQREENRQRLVRINVASGMKLLEQGDSFGSLPWFVEALSLQEGDKAREQNHRLRIGNVLRYAPRLVHNWFHAGPVNQAEFSPDGDRVLTASEDGTARVWEVASGRLLLTLQHTGKVSHAAFSPDGGRVVTVQGLSAQVWDGTTGKPVGVPMHHALLIRVARFSPDGRRIVTASKDQTSRIWNAATGEPLLTPLAHDKEVVDAAWSPNGQRVATIGADSNVRVWDAETAGMIRALSGVGRYVYNVSFSADSRRVLWNAWGKAGVNDAQTGLAITLPLRHTQGIISAEFSPDGRQVLTASEDQTFQVWNSTTGEALGAPVKHTHALRSASFSPDGQAIITASDDGMARLYDTAQRELICPPLKHSGRLTGASFSPDGAYVLTAGVDGMVRLWDMATGGIESLVLPHKKFVRQIAVSPDGSIVATASLDKQVRLWHTLSGQPTTTALTNDLEIGDLRFSPDGRRIATAGLDGTIRQWDTGTGTPVGSPIISKEPLFRIAFSEDGETVSAAGGEEVTFRSLTRRAAVNRGVIKVQTWNSKTGAPVSPPVSLDRSQNFAEFSPDRQRVATPCDDQSVVIWETVSGRPLVRITPRSAMTCLRFSPDGRRIVTADGVVSSVVGVGEAQVWDAETGQPLSPPLVHQAEVCTAAFSPDGRWVVTGSRDGVARVWNAATGEPRTPPLMHNYFVFDACFSADGRAVLTGSGDRTTRVWDAVTGELLAPLFRHPGFVFHVAFTPDSRRVIAALEQSLVVGSRLETNVSIWELTSDERPVEDLRLLAQLLAGHRIDSTSSLVPLEAEAFQKDWNTIRTRYPKDFTPLPEMKLAWHEREAKRSETAQRWALAARHLHQIAAARPDDAALSNRLAKMESRVTLAAEPRSNVSRTNLLDRPGTVSFVARDQAETNFQVLALDEFSGQTTLGWQVVRPDPAHVNLTNAPGCLTIVGQNGGIFGLFPTNAPTNVFLARNLHLLTNTQPAEVPLMITTCLVGFNPHVANHQAGLLIYNDDDNYLKLSLEYILSTGKVRLARLFETDGKVTLVPGTTRFTQVPERIWLRIVKSGKRYAFYYSLDGRRYVFEGSGNWGDGQPKKLGLLAEGSNSSVEFDASFDFFEIRKQDPPKEPPR